MRHWNDWRLEKVILGGTLIGLGSLILIINNPIMILFGMIIGGYLLLIQR